MTGRELDAWLAEHLNVWVWDDEYKEARPPLLSSTGDGMLLVLGHLIEWGYTVDIRHSPGWGDGWYCEVDDREHNGVAKGCDSLPLAVALAAKAALETAGREPQ